MANTNPWYGDSSLFFWPVRPVPRRKLKRSFDCTMHHLTSMATEQYKPKQMERLRSVHSPVCMEQGSLLLSVMMGISDPETGARLRAHPRQGGPAGGLLQSVCATPDFIRLPLPCSLPGQ